MTIIIHCMISNNNPMLNRESESESESANECELHPLKNRWVLWGRLSNNTIWTISSYVKIATFTSLEQTMAIMDTLTETMIKSLMLFVMKEGIEPMWEDPANVGNGAFSNKINSKGSHEIFRKYTYALVGEELSTNPAVLDSIAGITISPKKNFWIIKIWMTTLKFQNPAVITCDIKGSQQHGCLFCKHSAKN